MARPPQSNSSGRSSRSAGHTGPQKPTVRRVGRDRGLKVNTAAARGISSGHPWVFRDSVLRPLEGLQSGASVRVQDQDGNHLAWALYEPQGAIAARIVSLREDFEWGPEVIARRVELAVADRARLGDEVSAACRLIHTEGDSLPGVAVDRLGDYLLVYKYARVVDDYLDHLLDALDSQLSPRGIYLQDRVKPVTAEERRPGAALMRGKVAPTEITVEEDGLSFVVDVTAPVSPGLFLDLREGRRLCESVAKDKRVLNLFSFTGSFGLRALRGGAKSVVNIDAAARSHARCRQNLEASGLDAEACKALTGDVFKHLEKLRQRDELFDLVVVDPPPFSRVKGRVFSALRDWQSLIEAIAPVVAEGGEILAVSNASRLPEEHLMTALGAGAVHAHRGMRLVGECGLPADFPVPPAFSEGRYLRIKRLRLD